MDTDWLERGVAWEPIAVPLLSALSLISMSVQASGWVLTDLHPPLPRGGRSICSPEEEGGPFILLERDKGG